MEQAVHQTLINDIETMLSIKAGIDEHQAKTLRKSAQKLIGDSEEHPLKQNLNDCLGQLRTRVHAQIEKRDKDLEQVMEELSTANKSIKAEKLADAEKATQRALSIAGQIPGLSNQRRSEIDKQLDKIYPRMRKLSAWRHWGTTQARENLIDKMKMLVESRLDPNKIANTIREAKAQWQEWEKSGDRSEHALWKEFSAACDAAYAPCKVRFKEQKKERKANLAEKRALIEQIKQRYEETDWKKPDWKAIDKWARQTKGQFFKIGHTDYKQHSKLKADLDLALGKFETHLERERARSLKARQMLIEKIQKLDELENNFDAIKQLETLRKEWQVTVLEKRGVENKLWEQFQKAQDLIYAKRKAARKDEDQARKDNLEQKREIVDALQQASKVSAAELLAGHSVLAQTQDQFKAIGHVPKPAEKRLMDSWKKAQKTYQSALKLAKQAEKNTQQQAMLDKARLCAQFEQHQLKGKSIDVDKLQKAYAKLAKLSDQLETSFGARLKAIANGSAQSLDENTEAQLDRCLKLEVMLDMPTPAEYTQAKMAFQIERLSASMKKQSQAQETPETLRTALLSCGAINADQFDPIWARIEAIFAPSA